jgi:hypothetical protein
MVSISIREIPQNSLRPAAVLAFMALLVSPACAQQDQPNPQPAPAADAAVQAQSSAQTPAPVAGQNSTNPPGTPKTQKGTSKDRLFFVLPNFLTLENVGQVPPLTPGEKYKAVARGAFDIVEIPWYGFLSGINQLQNSEAGYGQGAEGYAKRYAASFADGTIENFMVGAVLPSILRQDPRYYQMGKGGFMHRVGYAMSRIVITRSDSGSEQFNYSEIFGSAISAGVSTYAYHPHADRTVANTTHVWGTQVGYDTLTLVVREFWPDIRRKIIQKAHPDAVKH